MRSPLRIAVLASGSGTNLEAILDRFQSGTGGASPVTVTRVIGSRPGIGALERARRAGVDASVLPEDGPAGPWLLERLSDAGAGLVVLAGWLKLVPADVVRQYRGRMINIHPALLPAFGGPGMYGHRVHEAVVTAGVRVSGVTVHFVDEIYDHGPIIAQWPVPVLHGDDAESLAKRVLAVEHRVLPSVVEAFAEGGFHLAPDGRVEWSRAWFEAEEFEISRGRSRTPDG